MNGPATGIAAAILEAPATASAAIAAPSGVDTSLLRVEQPQENASGSVIIAIDETQRLRLDIVSVVRYIVYMTDRVRVSRLTLAAMCGGSIHAAHIATPITDHDDEPARVGSACHMVMDGVDPRVAAQMFNVDVDDVTGRTEWARGVVVGHPADLIAEERRIESDDLSGQPDRVYWDARSRVMTVVDWKFGYRTDDDHSHQLMGYAHLARSIVDGWDDDCRVTCVTVWAMSRDVESHDYTAADVENWYQWLKTNVLAWDGRYTPGEHCSRCPLRQGCAAREEAGATALQLLSGVRSISRLDPPEILELWDKLKIVKALCDDVNTAIRKRIEDDGGKVEAAKGSLGFEEQQRVTIKAELAVPLLIPFLGDDLWKVLRITKTRLDEAIAAKSRGGERGNIKKTRDGIYEALRSAGAIDHIMVRRIRRRTNEPRARRAIEQQRRVQSRAAVPDPETLG